MLGHLLPQHFIHKCQLSILLLFLYSINLELNFKENTLKLLLTGFKMETFNVSKQEIMNLKEENQKLKENYENFMKIVTATELS